MSEYITKDAVFDLLHGQDELILFTRSYKENGSVGERLCNAISAIPAADVEPVVRCKECRRWHPTESDTPNERYCSFMGKFTRSSFYCGQAERSGSGE